MKPRRPFFLGLLLLNLCAARPGQSSNALDEWQIIASAAIEFRGLAYNEGHFAAVGGGTNILVSTNGANWFLTSVASTSNFGGLLAAAAGAGQFVAVGGGGTIVSSPDGLQWTVRRTGALRPYEEFWAVTYGEGRFVAVGFDNSGAAIAATSTNGIDWEKFSVPIQTTPRNIAYGQGLYVAAGSPVSMYSRNGRDWTPLNGVTAQGIAYGGGQFIATLLSTGYRSSNGVNWTQIPLPVLASPIQNYYTAAYANGTFIIGGFCDECPNTNRPSLLATSTDGLHWTSRLFGADRGIGAIRDIVFVDGVFYLADQWGKIWKSGRTAPQSPARITHVTSAGRQTVLSVAVIPGFHYVLECADRLDSSTWVSCTESLLATSDELIVTDADASPSARFYRVRVE